MTKFYILIPIIGMALFAMFYSRFNTAHMEKLAAAKVAAENERKEKAKRDIANRELAINAAIEAQEKRKQEREERERVTILVQARDVAHSLDATHLGRDEGGEVQGESLRDLASTSALSISVGRPSTGAEVVTLLERTSKERGGPPLLLFVDGGSNYAALEVVNWCRVNMVILLRSEPRTPQHNAWVERGHRELKEDAELGKGCVLEPLPCKRWTTIGGHLEIADWAEGGESVLNPDSERTDWCERTKRAMVALNELRTRPSRGGMTAAALDAALPRGDDLVCRESLYRKVCRDIELAEQGARNTRARLRARRNVVLRIFEESSHSIRADEPRRMIDAIAGFVACNAR